MTEINHAFVLAAGMGTRMMPLTADKPKPMIEVLGKPMIGHILDHLKCAGVSHVTVNGYYKPAPLKRYLDSRHDLTITFSEEKEVLETGGGLLYGLGTMPENTPFFIINGDAFWPPEQDFVLNDLKSYWRDEMDILLLLQNRQEMARSIGDYDFIQDARISRNHDRQGTHMFNGIRIAHPRIFEGLTLEKFSFLKLMDAADAKGTLYGLENRGSWYHLSTPDDIAALHTQFCGSSDPQAASLCETRG